jgi:hypothetical protein
MKEREVIDCFLNKIQSKVENEGRILIIHDMNHSELSNYLGLG